MGANLGGQLDGHILLRASGGAGDGGTAQRAHREYRIDLGRSWQLALELAPFGVSANGVGPGPVATALALEGHTPQMRADYHANIPEARYATPEEVAEAVAFLAAPGTRYINGETLFIDGGFLASGVDVRSAQALGNAELDRTVRRER